jgi:hypothetical protein
VATDQAESGQVKGQFTTHGSLNQFLFPDEKHKKTNKDMTLILWGTARATENIASLFTVKEKAPSTQSLLLCARAK